MSVDTRGFEDGIWVCCPGGVLWRGWDAWRGFGVFAARRGWKDLGFFLVGWESGGNLEFLLEIRGDLGVN